MTAAHGRREQPQTSYTISDGQSPPARHAAGGGGAARQGERSKQTKLSMLVLLSTGSAALLAVLAITVVVHDARVPHLLRGGTLAAVSILSGLLVLVPLVTFAVARRVTVTVPVTVAVMEPDTPVVSLPRPAPAERPVAEPAPRVLNGVAPGDGGEDVFVHLSRRLQSLVHRQIELLDSLENEVEEPDLLKGLFGVDHLATRMRRHAENLAVLGGSMARRQWTRPVSVMEMLRSAVSETLEYARVQVIPRAPGYVNGYAVADVIHLLAELVENATAFSPPDTKVVLRAYPVTAGLAIEIDDRGLGMRPEEYQRLNALLREPSGISVQELLQGGRIGLYVVAQLARRHGIAVQLQPNITGGIQALVVLPQTLVAQIEQRAVETRQVPPPLPIDPRPLGQHPHELQPAVSRLTPAPAATVARSAFAMGNVQPPATGSAPSGDVRPPLPVRRPQEHLAAELLETPDRPADRVGEEPTPSLMANFRRGLSQGATAPWPTTTPAQYAEIQETDT